MLIPVNRGGTSPLPLSTAPAITHGAQSLVASPEQYHVVVRCTELQKCGEIFSILGFGDESTVCTWQTITHAREHDKLPLLTLFSRQLLNTGSPCM